MTRCALRCLAWGLVMFAWVGVGWAKDAPVWIVASADGGIYAEVSNALARNLPDAEVQIMTWRQVSTKQGPPPTVIVALGVEALQHVVKVAEPWPKTNIVALVVPRASLEALHAQGGARLSGIYLDQPFSRQMQWLAEAMPERKTLGVLLGPNSKAYSREIRAAARQSDLDLVLKVIENREEVAPALQSIFADSQIFLTVPDSVVFNSQMVQYVLIASYRHGVPLLGYSAPLVKAGAVAALVSEAAQIGRQGAALVRKLIDGGRASIQAPDDFEVKINPSVMHALDLAIDENALGKKARSVREAP
jgi:putative ABC transport system substrate-binding protein